MGDMFKSKYLKAADIQGQPVLTIDSIAMDDVGTEGQTDIKPIVSFRETEQMLILNVTNGNAIIAATGQQDTDGWVGHQIQLRVEKVEFRGKYVDAIRINPNPMNPPQVPQEYQPPPQAPAPVTTIQPQQPQPGVQTPPQGPQQVGEILTPGIQSLVDTAAEDDDNVPF